MLSSYQKATSQRKEAARRHCLKEREQPEGYNALKRRKGID
jgi:hypothetical protein